MQLLFCTGGKRTDGLKAADIVPILRERVAYLSGINNQILKSFHRLVALILNFLIQDKLLVVLIYIFLMLM